MFHTVAISHNKKLLREAIRFVKCHTFIANKNIEVIFHARNSDVYNNDQPGVKKRQQL